MRFVSLCVPRADGVPNLPATEGKWRKEDSSPVLAGPLWHSGNQLLESCQDLPQHTFDKWWVKETCLGRKLTIKLFLFESVPQLLVNKLAAYYLCFNLRRLNKKL